ncbi:MAG: hypothetical protein R2708_24520 [Vicinamibacterales bacterium]
MTAVIGAAASYTMLFVILLSQALLGQPLLGPQGPIAIALAAWAGATLIFGLAAWRAVGGQTAGRAAMEPA